MLDENTLTQCGITIEYLQIGMGQKPTYSGCGDGGTFVVSKPSDGIFAPPPEWSGGWCTIEW